MRFRPAKRFFRITWADFGKDFPIPGYAIAPSILLRAVRKKIDASGKSIYLEIDGGVKADNIGAIAAAGADTFVAGSAIFNAPDYADVIGKMRAAVASAHR